MTPLVCPFCICARTENLHLLLEGSIDLSKATKLRDASFRPGPWRVEWVTTAFQTILKHRELEKISIDLSHQVISSSPHFLKQSADYSEWLDLDRLLVEFWESRLTDTFSPKVTCVVREWVTQDLGGHAECLFPEMEKRGAIDLIIRGPYL